MIRSTAISEPGAVVRLRVAAICLPDSRVTVHHGGMFFTERTDAHGRLDVIVPAMAERAVFMLTFAGEQMSMAVTDVPDIADYSRVVLQWQGHGDVALHVGHEDEGRVIRLGNRETAAPMLADVYSVPTPATGAGDGLDLTIEVQVTERNCGSEIEAQTLQLDEERRPIAQTLVLSVPACEAVGDHLVLNNVLEDLKIATR